MRPIEKSQNAKAANTFHKRKGRVLVIDGEQWKWVMGREGVVAHSEHGVRMFAFASDIKGFRDPNLFSRGKRKVNGDGMMTPGEVTKWIRDNKN